MLLLTLVVVVDTVVEDSDVDVADVMLIAMVLLLTWLKTPMWS